MSGILEIARNEAGITRLTLNRPEKLNALDDALLAELDGALAAIAADEAVRAVIVTGAGKAFAAGADVGRIAGLGPEAGRALARRGQRVFDRLEGLGKPVLAAVNGVALGGGCELALACHLRVAAEGAKLGTPEVRLGLVCGYGGTQRLPRLVGRARALELLLTGEAVDAAEALRIGLVNRVVPAADLLAASEALLGRALANAPVSLRLTLEAVNGGAGLDLRAGLDLEANLFGLACATDDMREGTRAFLEKRPARFTGR